MIELRAQKGFTLIELIVVISILGILSAVAIPRFMSVQSDARIAVVNGMVGALNSAVAIARAQYKLAGNPAATTVLIDGRNIDVVANSGIPRGTAAGIGLTLDAMTGFSANYTLATNVTFTPTSFSGSGNCHAIYNESTGVATASISGC